MSGQQFSTIHEMLNAFYGNAVDTNKITKSNYATTVTGLRQRTYGAMAFSQFNQEANGFAILPKRPWDYSGYRAMTAKAGSAADGGVAEGGTVPEPIRPTFLQIDINPKTVSHTFEVTMVHDLLAKKSRDDIFGSFEEARPITAAKHVEALNQQLLLDGNTLAGDRFESIDRVTASTAAASAASWTTGDEDIYGIDRSANSWADAVVDFDAGDEDRTFRLEMVEDMLGALEGNGARTNLLLTNTDTKWRVISQAQSSVRYDGVVAQNQEYFIGINGVETEKGMNLGVRVATVYNVPMFASKDVPKDTIGRIYALDTTVDAGTDKPRLHIAMLQPTMYFETGPSAADQNPFVLNKFSSRGGFVTVGELVCTRLNCQGSIRNLK